MLLCVHVHVHVVCPSRWHRVLLQVASSTLRRAIESADAVGSRFPGARRATFADLREMGYGSLEGVRMADIGGRPHRARLGHWPSPRVALRRRQAEVGMVRSHMVRSHIPRRPLLWGCPPSHVRKGTIDLVDETFHQLTRIVSHLFRPEEGRPGLIGISVRGALPGKPYRVAIPPHSLRRARPSGVQRCAARCACSLVGRVFRWRSSANVQALRIMGGGAKHSDRRLAARRAVPRCGGNPSVSLAASYLWDSAEGGVRRGRRMPSVPCPRSKMTRQMRRVSPRSSPQAFSDSPMACVSLRVPSDGLGARMRSRSAAEAPHARLRRENKHAGPIAGATFDGVRSSMGGNTLTTCTA